MTEKALGAKHIVLDILIKFFKGALVGLVVIVPGMSGGTMILMLGLYEELMNDMAKLKIWRLAPFGLGLVVGLILSGWMFGKIFARYAFIILGFLLGCVLASVRTVIGDNRKLSKGRVLAIVIGLALGVALTFTTDVGTVVENPTPANPLYLMFGAALSSALMVLPGVPGGSVLYMMGLFEEIMLALANLKWSVLALYAAGAAIGMVGLSNLLNRIYNRHKDYLSWLFAGLIVGSARILIPKQPGNVFVFIFLVIIGFVATWAWETHSRKKLAQKTNKGTDGEEGMPVK